VGIKFTSIGNSFGFSFAYINQPRHKYQFQPSPRGIINSSSRQNLAKKERIENGFAVMTNLHLNDVLICRCVTALNESSLALSSRHHHPNSSN
jgi:hypothetical protein